MAKVLVKLAYYHWVEVPGREPDGMVERMDFYDRAVELAVQRQLDHYPAASIEHDVVRVRNDQS